MNENEKDLVSGVDAKRKTAAAKEAKSKKKMTWVKIIVALCLVLCVVLTVYESNFLYRILKAADVNGTKYSVAEYNWMYTTSYYELYNSYGEYASYMFDTTKPLKEQQYSEDMTMADYMATYTDSSLTTLTAFYDAAKEANYELSDELKASLDSEINGIKQSAQSAGYDMNSYLALTFGRGVNEKVMRSMYERYYTAYSYAAKVREDADVTPEAIEARYNEDPSAFKAINYNYLYVGSDAEDEAQKEVAMAEAKTTAEEVLAAEDMKAYASETLGTEFTSVEYAVSSNMVADYSEWLFDSARKEGDKTIIESTNGYYIFEYAGECDTHYNMVSARHILVQPEDTEDEASWNEAKTKADEYYKTWKDLGGGENNFANVAMGYSQDTGTSKNGGLMENITKGQTVKEFNDWCFDPARKEGDTDIIKTEYGYHIMYFVGEGEDYYTNTVSEAIRTDVYDAFIAESTEGYELTPLGSKKLAGQHL